jgi:hypothetical protein
MRRVRHVHPAHPENPCDEMTLPPYRIPHAFTMPIAGNCPDLMAFSRSTSRVLLTNMNAAFSGERTPMQTFDAHGVRFNYPDDWTLTHDHGEDSLTVNLQTPGTAFWSLTLLTECPPVDEGIPRRRHLSPRVATH